MIKKIKEEMLHYTQKRNEHYKQAQQLEQNLAEYLDMNPSKVVCFDESIDLYFEELTEEIIQKLETFPHQVMDVKHIKIALPRVPQQYLDN